MDAKQRRVFPGCLCPYQTLVLILKNILFSIRRPFLTLFQLLLPSLILVSLYSVSKNLGKDIILSTSLSPKTYARTSTTRHHVLPYGVLDISGKLDSSTLQDIFEPVVGALASTVGMQHVTNRKFTSDDFGDCPDGSICLVDLSCESSDGYYSLRSFFSKWDARFSPLGMFWLQWLGEESGVGNRKNVSFSYVIARNLTTASLNPFLVDFTESSAEPQPFDRGVSLQTALFHAMAEANSPGTSLESSLILDSLFPAPDEDGDDLEVPSPADVLTYPMFFLGVFLATLMVWFKINHERNVKLRHGMLLNGLFECSYWCSWCITESILLAASMIIFLIFATSLLTVFEKVSFLALFVIFWVFAVATLVNWLMCAACECCSSTVCTVVVSFLSAFGGITLVFVLMSSVDLAMVFVTYPILFASQILPVVSWSKLMWDIKVVTDDPKSLVNGTFVIEDLFRLPDWGGWDDSFILPPSVSILILIADIVFFLLLTFYFDAVIASSEKVARGCCCCFEFLCRCCRKKSSERARVDAVLFDEENEASVIPDLDSDKYKEYQAVVESLQSDSEGVEYPLKIVKLSKIYSKKWYQKISSTIALSDLTLYGKKSEVLVILGHNGAGKTTLIDVLTGTISPSTGDCLLGARSVAKSAREIKRGFGICPQYDIVVPELTVMQHLYLYASLKGLYPWDPQLERVISYLELNKLRHQVASKCSGGEKRRLTFACSVLGNPQTLFLDEPTTGLDVVRKQKVWEYIARVKHGRTVVLTTHSMEEADAIGDKIAFLALGRLRAIGTSAHLKKRFGCGYVMDLILSSDVDVDSFKDEMRSLSPHLRIASEVGSSLTYSLPFSVDRETKLETFRYLETQHDSGRLTSFRLSETTLEEVFMNVTHGNAQLLAVLEQQQGGDMFELSVVLEEDSEPFETIQVAPSDTLALVRTHLLRRCGNVIRGCPFSFVSDGGVIIQDAHEAARTVGSFLPLLRVRLLSKPSPLEESENEDVLSSRRVVSLEEYDAVCVLLQEKDQMVVRLQSEVSQLKDRLKEVLEGD